MSSRKSSRRRPEPDLAMRIGAWAHAFKPSVMRRARVRASIRDFLGCVVAGSRRPELRPALWLAQGGGVPVWGLPDSFDPAGAALVAGTAGSMLQLHDLHTGGGLHPSSPIIPAAWSALHSFGKGRGRGEDFVRAVATGYEVANRIALACSPQQVNAGSSSTGTAGSLGAAVSAAVVGGHDAAGIARAVTNCALLLPITPFVALTSHGELAPLHSGIAARAGFEAARIARDASAGTRLLEGTSQTPGLISLLHGDPRKIVPEAWHGETLDEIGWKFSPACFASQTALEAILRLQRVSAKSIQRVTVHVPDRMLSLVASGPTTAHLYDRLMSMRWVLARALELGHYDARDAGKASGIATALAERIDIVHAPSLDRLKDTLAADIELRTRGGVQRIEYRRPLDGEPPTAGPRGWTRRLDLEALNAKFTALVAVPSRFEEPLALVGAA